MKRREFLGGLAGMAAIEAFARPMPSSWNDAYDVIVVGAGGAGLAAALSAAENGASVFLIEKMPFIGGDTLICGGYLNAAGTELQKKLGITDSPELFYQQTLDSSRGSASEPVLRRMTEEALPTLNWLVKNGVNFEDRVYMIYGSIHRRCHKPIMPRGSGFITALSEACIAKGVIAKANCALCGIVVDEDGKVRGIEYTHGFNNLFCRAKKGVILATGGFGANQEMVAKYTPKFNHFPVDSASGSTGEALQLAADLGADTANMDVIETIPEGAHSKELSVRLYTISKGLVYVNSRGERFVDELSERQALGEAILNEPHSPCFTIVDSDNVKALDAMQLKNLYRSYFAGLTWKANSLESLASQIGIPIEALRKSIREVPERIRPRKPPFWAVKMILWVHYTLGGLVIDKEARCLDKNGKPIQGLYAAGQITGNVHGKNRLGGNGLTDAFVFGRIAGANAAKGL